MTAGVVNCTNCYRVDTIRVAIKNALVFMPPACENVYRPFSLSSIVNDKVFGSIHSLTVVSRSPAAAINANIAVLTIGERSSLVGSGDSTT